MEEFGRERVGERAAAKCFENLVVWQKAHQFVLLVYRLTNMFPREEIYGLTVQFRRAAVSVAANIAEGFRKRGRADKLRFLNISQGSAEECRYYLILAKDLGYQTDSMAVALLDEVGRLLVAYAKGIARSTA
ncbi:MAG TPA: four helix bundle protein [Kiritimatiellia bacterium]|jgi:four helix bundle protein|nr:four helix bundle protein [Kiritimatiellia bacterium]MBP9572510.1 four helix bundle protein [Kiritimatiellia bacterium]HOU57964.1 four helix bundle protein [Kiritimatiellia bacterium]HQF19713.1 four helix bundle protein [Kiritimatiellia bacterium]HQG73681.1 four helix bundle protein [Kiritimatiellia bacterium]